MNTAQTRHSVRNKSGQFTPKASWNKNGSAGFWNWIKNVKPRILTVRNNFEVWEPTNNQRKRIDEILKTDQEESFIHSMSLLIEPRRHGKSTIFALILLWLFCSRKHYVIQLLGNSQWHCEKTQFNLILQIIENTPKLNTLIPPKNRLIREVRNPRTKSVIRMPEGTSTTSAFGSKINVLWVSDLHASPDITVFNSVQASLLDSQDSLLFIDSNISYTDSVVDSLFSESKTDPSIYAHHTEYKNFDEFVKLAPIWIDRQKAARLKRTALEVDYLRDILGQKSDAKNALFSAETIRLCQSQYKCPVDDLKSLIGDRAYKVSGALDRARSLIATSGDHSVWTCIAKTASPQSGEAEYFILNQTIFTLNTSKAIKKAILRDHENFCLNNVVLENFEVGDLSPWLSDMKIPHELVSGHETVQNSSFPELYRVAKEGRLHFSKDLKQLASEMSTFVYTQRPGGKYSFGHSSQKFHDDTVYSLNYAIFALREAVLNLYVLGNVQCTNKSARRHMCFIMGGSHELLCKAHCQPFHEIEAMFQQYKALRLDSELSIQEFYHTKIKREGALIFQAA